MHRAVQSCGLALFTISSLSAQRTALPPNAVGNSASGSTSGTASQPPAGNPAQNPEYQMPIFLSGRIVMEDGAAPPASIPIQRVCAGSPRTVAFTNIKGQFSFQWGQSSGTIPDASEFMRGPGMPASMVNTSMTNTSLMGCELTADAPGFRSGRLDLSNHRAADNPDLGIMVLHRLAGVEGTSVSVTALNAPKDARKAWEKGVVYLHKSKPAEAEKELEKAVGIYPKYANAWLDLGRARLQRQSEGSARDAWLKAIDADPKLVGPYLELGEMAAHRQDWPDAAWYLDRALKLDPVDYPRLWFDDAVADYNVHEFDRAEKNTREALKVPPANRDPRANRLLGLILLKKRDYAGAEAALRAYVTLAPNAKDIDQTRAQLVEIDDRLAAAKP